MATKNLKIKKWALTPHAAERLLERKITIYQLSLLLHDPEKIIHQGPKFILIRHFPNRKDNKLAAVVLEKHGENLWLVITLLINFEIKS